MDEEAIFRVALKITDPVKREAFLNEACAGEADWKRRIKVRLSEHENPEISKQTSDFLANPALRQMFPFPPRDYVAEFLKILQPSSRPDSLGRLEQYEILENVGRGGFGTVWRADDEKLQRKVAIKVIAQALDGSPQARAQVLNEARALTAVRHEHIVVAYTVEEEPIPLLIMEFIAGETLQAKLDRDGPLKEEEVVRIGREFLLGLAAAHAARLIHRDIKPANILLDPNGRVVLTDFGLAAGGDDAGSIVGTPQYMSPEQATRGTIDARSDLFSFGSVLYAMCSGKPPFRADDIPATLELVAQAQPRPIREIVPTVSARLAAIIGKLHEKCPSRRFASAEATATALGSVMNGTHDPYASPEVIARKKRGIVEEQLNADVIELGLHQDLKAPPDNLETGLIDRYGFSWDVRKWTHKSITGDLVEAAGRFRRFGDGLRMRGDAERARIVYDIARRLLDDAGNTPEAESELGKLFSSFAEYDLRLGTTEADLREGVRLGLESVGLHEKQWDQFELFQSHRVLADVFLELGDLDEAERRLKKAGSAWELSEVGLDDARRKLLGWLERSRGDLLAARGRWSDARQKYESALNDFCRGEDPIGIGLMWEKLGDMDGKPGDSEAATRELAEAIQTIESVPGAEHLLGRMRQSFKFGRIGVASSVSYQDGGFDPLLSLEFAAQNHFSPVQLYLDSKIVSDPRFREEVVAAARTHDLPILLHAPGLLKLPEATDAAIVDAALEMTAGSRCRVVYHFDETLETAAESLALVERLCARGIVPCIENYHQPRIRGEENARRNYAKFRELWSLIRGRALEAIPVIDIPRMFHERLELTNQASCALAIEVLRELGRMGFPVLFHLIDCTSPRQLREEWCPLGKGIIPYAEIFRGIAGAVRCDDVVLEFEDLRSPLPSRTFLTRLPYRSG